MVQRRHVVVEVHSKPVHVIGIRIEEGNDCAFGEGEEGEAGIVEGDNRFVCSDHLSDDGEGMRIFEFAIVELGRSQGETIRIGAWIAKHLDEVLWEEANLTGLRFSLPPAFMLVGVQQTDDIASLQRKLVGGLGSIVVKSASVFAKTWRSATRN